MGVGINDFDNVKKYQQVQQTRFGQVTKQTAAGRAAPKSDMNTSIFASGQNARSSGISSYHTNVPHNPFVSSGTNAYAMLNSANEQGFNTSVQSRKGVSSWWENYERTAMMAKEQAYAAASSRKKSKSGTTRQVQQDSTNVEALNTITNAVVNNVMPNISFGQTGMSAQKCQSELDKAKTKNEVQQILSQIQNNKSQAVQKNSADKKEVENAKKENEKAVANEQETAGKEQEAVKFKEKADEKVNQSKSNVKDCESNLSTAKNNVSSAKNKLAQEKAKATKDNPNTEAIKAAEEELKRAEEKQKEAEQKLDKAKDDLKQAEKEQTDANRALDKAKSKHEKAQKEVTLTEQKVKTAETKEKESAQIVTDFEVAEQNAQKKLEELTQNEGVVEQVNNGNESPVTDNNSGITTSTPTSEVKKGDGQSSQFTPEEQQKIENSRTAIENLQPGGSVQCGNDTYTMSNDGSIAINGRVMYTNTQKSQAADEAANSTIKRIIWDKENPIQTN